MKLPFMKGDPTEALAKARAALAADEAELKRLLIERAAALVESDDLQPVEKLDRDIASRRRAAGIRRDRIALLETECAEQVAEQRERERQTLIDKMIKPRALDRGAKAARLEQAIRELGEAYFALIGLGPIVDEDWPYGSLPPRFGVIDTDLIRQEVAWALFSAGRPTNGRTTLPSPSNSGLGVTGVSPRGIAASVTAQSEGLLAHLREMPIGEVS